MPHRRRRRPFVRTRMVVVSALIASFAPLVAMGSAGADGTPNITLAEIAPATILYGNLATVTLTAANPTGTPAYNASFREVLPPGVSYVAGSTSPSAAGEPTVIADQPGTGQTTVIWSNTADIQPHSTTSITFKLKPAVEPAANELVPGSTYTDAASVYVNTDPRTIPGFTATGTPTATSTGSAVAAATTVITPISIAKTEDSPEAELPRGVHDHKATYTLTVTNSALDSTTGVSVDDYLPAGLEFLGCGGADHTSNAAGTNPGKNVEYPGASRLTAGKTLTDASCISPTTVETLSLAGTDGAAPTQPIAAGSTVYTHVVWTLPDLAPGASETITYLAGVPLRENTAAWSGATPALTGAQGSNLDNNSGPETHDTQSLTNLAIAHGTYGGPLTGGAANPVSASGTDTVKAVDLAIQKTVDDPTFTQGGVHTYTLNYQTSEYRYSAGTIITDTVPNGLCPLGLQNYDAAGSADCAPRTGVEPSLPYTSVTANSDGTFTVTWNLNTLPTNVGSSITMPTADRTSYLSGGTPTAPTLAGDSLTNKVAITGVVTGTCVKGTTLDPTCTTVGSGPIYSGEAAPAAASNDSQAGEQASEPTLVKRVATAPSGTGPIDCTSATYVTAPTEPTYQKGDTICFQLEVDFPAGLNAKNIVVTDILPPNASYVPGSAVALTGPAAPINTATIATTTTPAGEVVWTLGDPLNGDLYVGPGQVFAVDLAVTPTADPSSGNTFDLVDNLMKLTGVNSAGDAISLRSQAAYQLARPTLALLKGVAQVDGGAQNPPGTTNVLVHDGSAVTYRLDITDTGLEPAVNTAVSDTLPTQLTSCAAVTAISNSGTCTGTAAPLTLTWTNLPTVVPGTPLTLTYTTTMPDDLVAAAQLTNTATISSYEGQPNNGASPNTFTPGIGAEPAVTSSAQVHLAAPTFTKAVATSVTEGGNTTAQATIGETVTYTMSSVVAAGTTVYNASISDPLPAGQTYVSATVTVNGVANPAFSVTNSANIVTAAFPTPFTAPVGTDQTVVLTVTAIVADVAGNTRGATSTDTATLAYTDPAGVAQPTQTASSAPVTIVEPLISVGKTDTLASHAGPAGSTVPYVVTVTNSSTTNVSTAHNVVVTDTLPAGMGAPTAITSGGVYTPAADPNPATIVWTLTSLAPGASQQLKYSATLPNPATAQSKYLNTVGVTAASLATAGARTTGTGYTATANDTVTVGGATVAKTASPLTVTPGVDTTYTAVVTIPAGTVLPNLTAIDTLPDGMTFDAYGTITCARSDHSVCGADVVDTALPTPTKASDGTTRLAWFIGDVTEDTLARTITITYTAHPALTKHTGVKVVAGNALANSIAAYWNQSAGTDPSTIPAPSAFTTLSPPASKAVTVIEPNLSITKAASTSTPTPTVPFTYTVTITNSATNTSPAYDVVVNDPLPTGLTAPSAISDGGTYTGGVISWTIPGPLTAGTPVTRTFTTTLVASSQLTSNQTIQNTATIASYDAVSGGVATDPTRYRNYGPTSGSVNVAATFPALSIAKTTASGAASGSAFVGQPFGWHLTVTNSTTAAASQVLVTDTLPAGWTYNPGSTTINGVAVPDPTISGGGLTLTFTVPGPVTNIASALIAYTATPDTTANLGSPDINSASVTNAQDASGATGDKTGSYLAGPASATATITAADLTLTKTLTSSALVPGAPTTYGLAVTNHGPSAAAAGLAVVDTLPPGATAVTGSGPGWTCTLGTGATAGTISCTNPETLAANATDSNLSISLTMPSSTLTPVTNTAAVSSPTYDPNTTNNGATITTPPSPSADLKILKQHTGNFTPGQQGNYLLTVSNLGPSDETGTITVSDTLPTGQSYVSGSGNGWSCPATVTGQSITCTLPGPLTAGTTAAGLTITVLVGSSITTTPLTNTATVRGVTPDPDTSNNTATDPTTITPQADLSTNKVHIGAFTAGHNGTYTINVTNNGPSDAAGPITITDPLPTGETFVSGTGGTAPQVWTCAAAGQTVTCTLPGGLAAQANEPTLTLTVAIDPLATGALLNTATVSSPTPDPNTTNNSDTDNAGTTVTNADLSITKTPVGTSFTAGQNAQYTLIVTNAGPSAASGTQTVVDTLPSGETFVSGAGGTAPHAWACSAAAQVVTCTRPGPLGLTSSTITLTVAISSDTPAGSITNSATVSDTVTNDPNISNNDTGTVPQPVDSVANLTLNKTHSGLFTPGTHGTYSLVLNSTGPSDSAAPTVSDPLPPGETLVSASGTDVGTSTWSCSAAPGQSVLCTLSGPMPVGSSSTITVVVAVGSNVTGGPIVNTATASSSNAPTVTATDTITTVTPIAALTITKTHTGDFTAGGNGSYTITVANAGPSDSAGPITMTDTLPAEETYVSATGVGWTCPDAPAASPIICTLAGPLTAGSTAPAITLVVAVAATAADGSTLVNSAATTSPTDPTGASADDPTMIGAVADVSISKTHTGTFTPGQTATYALNVHNAGPSDASGPIIVSDTLPATETFDSLVNLDRLWSCVTPTSGQPGTITCTLTGALAATADAPTITVSVNVLAAAYPSVDNTATVTTPAADHDPDPTNNTSTDTAAVGSVADLAITKTHTGTALAGGQLSYTLTVTNNGITPDPGPVTVADQLPTGETFVSATGTGWVCPTPTASAPQDVVCIRAGSFEPTDTATITLVVTLGAAAVPTITNTATVAGTGTDPVPANNSASDAATVTPVANLILSKKLDGSTLVYNQQATYIIELTNQGPSSTSGAVTVTDDLPVGLSFVSAAAAGWTCRAAAQAVTCTTADVLTAASTTAINVVVLVGATTGTIINQASVVSATLQTAPARNVAATPPIMVLPRSGASSNLAATGADSTALLIWGAALVLAGAGLLLGGTRRRIKRT